MSSLDKEKKYWRSLEELEGSPELRELVQSEFPEQADELTDPLSRRRFMQLMGASLAFAGVAGTAGCRRWEKDEIVPLGDRPEGYVPGAVEEYATAMEIGGVAHGLVVSAFDGRPIKIEGNGKHPFGTGATSAFAQASVLGLYDPDRSLSVRKAQGAKATWSEVEELVRSGLNLGGGAGLRVLSEATSSPTVAALRKRLLERYPAARWHEYEPLSWDNERVGMQMAFGVAVRPVARLNFARRVVAIDADFLVDHPAAIRYAKDYAQARNPEQVGGERGENLMRLYAIESTLSNTGSMADHRLPLASSEIPAFLMELEAALDGTEPRGEDYRARFITALAKDLTQRQNRQRSLLIAGHRQPPMVHAMVARINNKLDAVGRTVEYLGLPQPENETHFQSIQSLAADMNAGRVSTLLILGGNPVYDAPVDTEFAAGLAKVQNSIHLSHYHDETSARCSWHLPRAHYLESWGDARSYDGTVSITQPLIEPLTAPRDSSGGGRSAIEVLGLLISGEHVSGQKLVKQTFDSQYSRTALTTRSWRQALHDGFVVGTGYQPVRPAAPRAVPAAEPVQLGKDNIEVVFTASSHAYDGRFANNGWLQETPDFITKLTWDNAALINPNTADALGISSGEIIRISLGNRQVEVAAYTQPGQARNSIALALGHGRTRAGRVAGSEDDGVRSTGFDVYKIRTAAAAHVATRATVAATGKSYVLASTQDHWQLDSVGAKGMDKRMPSLVREAPIAEYLENPDFVKERTHEVEMPIKRATARNNGKSLWEEHKYTGARPGTNIPIYRWGMAIDLDKCTGCNSCMVACQAENNVPIVGKDEVLNSREMHWIRIDRYFAGDDVRDNPEVKHQPVACQHCEMAPCEQVCPVGATLHSHEGLNDMVYNRCVGTRYCANNCPYKVRRFNFLDYQNRPQAPGGSLDDSRNNLRKLLFNPDVTVRSRGVMEKCTFCVQRIQRQKITAKNQGRRLRDGEIVTACQQACPSNAIVFGDLNDQNSKVGAAHRTKRSYELLDVIYTKPRNLFLARIRNPNPELG